MMATIKIPWGDTTGGNIVLTYEGSGNGSILVSSDTPNSGANREKAITLQTTNQGTKVSVVLTIRQTGQREPLNASDGILKDHTGDIILVLK